MGGHWINIFTFIKDDPKGETYVNSKRIRSKD